MFILLRMKNSCSTAGIELASLLETILWSKNTPSELGTSLINVININVAEVNLFWAAHQVHHSSEDYNLTTALRQSSMQKFSTWVKNM